MGCLLNISIDDVSPHPRSSIDVTKQCFRVLEHFPNAKFTLFVPIAYWRTVGETATMGPLRLDQHRAFCASLASLPTQSFEICYHGLYHGLPGKSNNDELQHLSYDAASRLFETMFNIANGAGLFDAFKMVLRPPAWRMSPSAINAAKDAGFKCLALSPDEYAMNTYQGAESSIKHVMFNVCPPAKPLQLFDRTEIVYHACDWDPSFLSDSQTTALVSFLRDHEGQYEFSFIENLAG